MKSRRPRLPRRLAAGSSRSVTRQRAGRAERSSRRGSGSCMPAAAGLRGRGHPEGRAGARSMPAPCRLPALSLPAPCPPTGSTRASSSVSAQGAEREWRGSCAPGSRERCLAPREPSDRCWCETLLTPKHPARYGVGVSFVFEDTFAVVVRRRELNR